jgi:MFS family permease
MADKTDGSWRPAEQASASWAGRGQEAGEWGQAGQEAVDWAGAGAWGRPAADVPNRLAILGVLLVGAFMILLDATIVNVAIPTIQRGMHASDGAIEWIVSGYALTYGLLIAWNLHGWGWRPVFLVNLPIGILGLAAALRLVPESRGQRASLDLVGVALVSAVFVLITYPLTEGQGRGWPPWTFASLAAALPVLGLFIGWERLTARRGKTPLVNLELFGTRAFSSGTAVSLAYFAGFVGLVFVLSVYLQVGLGWSALHAGLAILPFAVGTFAGAAASDQVAQRIGRRALQLGSVIVALGTLATILLIHAEGPRVSGVQLLPALLAAGIGNGLMIAPLTTIVLSAVPWQEAGSASGVLSAAQRLGQGLGVAIVGVALFGSLGGPHAATRARVAQEFTHGAQVASLYALAAMIGTAAIIPLLPRGGQHEEWSG